MTKQNRPQTSSPGGSVPQVDEISHIASITALSRRERDSLLTRLRRRTIPPNRVIFRRGGAGSTMAFIISGSAKVRYTTGTGQEVIVTILSAGNYFGEIGMITGRARSFDVVTIEKMDLFELTREDFIQHTQTFKGFSLSLLVAVAGRLEEAGKRIMDLTEEDIPTRLFRILLQLAQIKNVAGDNKMVVTPRPSTRDLVGLVGEPRDRVLAAIAKLQTQGILVDEPDRLILNSIPMI